MFELRTGYFDVGRVDYLVCSFAGHGDGLVTRDYSSLLPVRLRRQDFYDSAGEEEAAEVFQLPCALRSSGGGSQRAIAFAAVKDFRCYTLTMSQDPTLRRPPSGHAVGGDPAPVWGALRTLCPRRKPRRSSTRAVVTGNGVSVSEHESNRVLLLSLCAPRVRKY
jgi:hypothetical protein